jgi:hypothetical protein
MSSIKESIKELEARLASLIKSKNNPSKFVKDVKDPTTRRQVDIIATKKKQAEWVEAMSGMIERLETQISQLYLENLGQGMEDIEEQHRRNGESMDPTSKELQEGLNWFNENSKKVRF